MLYSFSFIASNIYYAFSCLPYNNAYSHAHVWYIMDFLFLIPSITAYYYDGDFYDLTILKRCAHALLKNKFFFLLPSCSTIHKAYHVGPSPLRQAIVRYVHVGGITQKKIQGSMNDMIMNKHGKKAVDGVLFVLSFFFYNPTSNMQKMCVWSHKIWTNPQHQQMFVFEIFYFLFFCKTLVLHFHILPILLYHPHQASSSRYNNNEMMRRWKRLWKICKSWWN